MLDLGVIEPATSGYSLPMVLVAKKDKTHRFCVDYRKLNRVTEPEIEMIPYPDIIFARVARANFFNRMDLSKGIWQIKVNPADRPKLAFATQVGPFQWCDAVWYPEQSSCIYAHDAKIVGAIV